MLQIPPEEYSLSCRTLFAYLNGSVLTSTGIAFFAREKRKVKSTFTSPSQKDPVLLYQAFANILIAARHSIWPKETMKLYVTTLVITTCDQFLPLADRLLSSRPPAPSQKQSPCRQLGPRMGSSDWEEILLPSNHSPESACGFTALSGTLWRHCIDQ